MSFHIIIPARMASSRLPQKMIQDVAGKPLIQRVYEQACNYGAASVTVATDHPEIATRVQGFGGACCMTASEHPTGTDRLAEAAGILGLAADALVVNVQGDQPLIPKAAILLAVQGLAANSAAAVATLATPLQDSAHVTDPNVVKVVLDKAQFALQFSRAPIPWVRDPDTTAVPPQAYYRHLGLYVYRVRTLQQFTQWEAPLLEQMEKLEQLRILWHGGKIHVGIYTGSLGLEVDTAADLTRISEYFASAQEQPTSS